MQQRRSPGGQRPGGCGTPPGARDGGARTKPARPAAARRPATGSSAAAATGGPARRTPAPRPRRRTGRTTILATVLLALLLAYAYPVRVYLTQQAEIQTLEDKQAAQRAHILELREERDKWNDDEYVRAQARRRLHYVLPGETAYVVLDGGPPTGAAGTAAGPGHGKPAGSWYGGLWSSIGVANR